MRLKMPVPRDNSFGDLIGRQQDLNEAMRKDRRLAAIDDAIAASNRAGRKIGGREAKLIHAVLKGRN